MKAASQLASEAGVAVHDDVQVTLDARRSSLHLLRLDDDAGFVNLSEMLRGLGQSGYVVAPEQIDAMQVLLNPAALANCPEVIQTADRDGREQHVEALVANFSSWFFRLPPQKRRSEWQKLLDLCQDLPMLRRWLRDLESGLDVDCEPIRADDQLRDFGLQCCKVFVARQPERARLRQKLVAKYSQDPQVWEYVTWNMRFRHGHFINAIAG